MAHVPDSTLRHIENLSPDLQDAAFWLVYVVRSAGIPLQITSSVRTRAEQAEFVRLGVSRTERSAHMVGQAFDVDIHGWGRDEIPMWFWEELGWLGEYLGLRWGGRFSGFWDPGHFENPWAVV